MALGTKGPTMDLGPAVAKWGGTAIEEIFEEVRLTLTGADPGVVKEALYGDTPVDRITLGYSECNVTIPATRVTLSLLATILPGGSLSSPNSGVVLKPGSEVGRSMYDNGLPLIIKPIVDGDECANNHWMRLERTYPVPNFDVVFNLRDQRVYGLTFHAHPDETAGILWSAGHVNESESY